jgi:hypothetical protein
VVAVARGPVYVIAAVLIFAARRHPASPDGRSAVRRRARGVLALVPLRPRCGAGRPLRADRHALGLAPARHRRCRGGATGW